MLKCMITRVIYFRWIGDLVYMFVIASLPVSVDSVFQALSLLISFDATASLGIIDRELNSKQVISVCKNHRAMSKGGVAFRGDLRLLDSIIAVTMNSTAVLMRMETRRQCAPFPEPAESAGWAH